MSASDRSSEATAAGSCLPNQPYLLLSITALCWAGNAIVGRLAAGHIPPVTLSFLRWSIAFLIILPFAWKHLKRDWGAIRARLGMMIVLSVTGIGAFNTLQYWALEHTQALNTLLLQSAGPLFVAVWSRLVLCGLPLRLRRGVLDTAVDLGTALAPGDAAGCDQPVDAVLRRGVSLDAGVSVLQSRRAVDRRQPRRAVLSCGAGVRIGDGNRLSRRTPAAVPHHRLRAGADGRFRGVPETGQCSVICCHRSLEGRI